MHKVSNSRTRTHKPTYLHTYNCASRHLVTIILLVPNAGCHRRTRTRTHTYILSKGAIVFIDRCGDMKIIHTHIHKHTYTHLIAQVHHQIAGAECGLASAHIIHSSLLHTHVHTHSNSRTRTPHTHTCIFFSCLYINIFFCRTILCLRITICRSAHRLGWMICADGSPHSALTI